jgi:hypothetical protein
MKALTPGALCVQQEFAAVTPPIKPSFHSLLLLKCHDEMVRQFR